MIQAISLSSTKAVVFYRGGIYTSTVALTGIVCTISGTSISIGTERELEGSLSAHSFSGVALSESKIFVVYRDNGIKLRGIIITLSGTTLVKGTETQISTLTNSGQYPSVAKLTEDKVVVSYNVENGKLYAKICTISGNIITVQNDTEIGLSPTSSTSSTYCKSSIVALDENTIFAFYGRPSDYNLYVSICVIENNTLLQKLGLELSTTYYSGAVISATILDKNNIFIGHSYTGDYYVYGMLLNKFFETLVKTITSSTERIDGIAITSGTAGQIVSIKKPNV